MINGMEIASSNTWWGSVGKTSVKHNLLHRDAVSARSYIDHSHQNTVPMMTTVPVLTMATKNIVPMMTTVAILTMDTKTLCQ